MAAFAGIHQRRHVDVHAVLAKRIRHFSYPACVEIHNARDKFGSDRAARNTEFGAVVEQPVLGSGGR
ncbi:Uncharacterised protein [Mycobacterium tuberculosis]|nr:Uncharacterised protein [Mycobacterium tuberculosis]